MSRKPVLITVVLLVLAGLGYWIYSKARGEDTPGFRFTAVERGNLEAAVSATGALSAVTSVQVGTQVSGQVKEILTDFNQQVKQGQLVARIDPTLQQQAVQDAQANLDRAQAELDRSRLEYERNKKLFESKVLTEIEFNTAKYTFDVATASVKSAQIALQKAQRNLDYTNIKSPVDGIVVERSVDVGQTVTASMSTPQLFLIAKDLSEMQILASVDESDIGRIQPGQKVRFTVQAYPDRKFEGVVSQVRLQSKTTENVVNYTVVVSVKNADGKLLPGMTATVEFLTGTATDVLMVANAALRFRPPEPLATQLREQMQAKMKERMAARGQGATPGAAGAAAGEAGAGAGTANRPRGAFGQGGGFGGGAGQGGFGQGGGGRSNFGMLYYVDAQGKVSMMPVRTGLTDGQKTEITGRELKEGMQVITGVTQEQGQATTVQSPFQPQRPGGARRGGGMF